MAAHFRVSRPLIGFTTTLPNLSRLLSDQASATLVGCVSLQMRLLGQFGDGFVRTDQLVWQLPNDMERLPSHGTKAEDGKVLVQGSNFHDAQPSHHREAGAVDNGEVLVLPTIPYLLSNL